MTETIKDAERNHWVYRMPLAWRPYLQLSRLDRPIGYWLLALPGWIGLAFFWMPRGSFIKGYDWMLLILIGAIAMRGAGCTYNDIVDQDLDAKVERTALRPIPAGTVRTKQAWVWLLAQCFIGLLVLFTLPRFAQIVALCSIPLVAAYPFMKRITWWPQVWLGLTFNWAVLVAYSIYWDGLNLQIILLYTGLIFWTIGYDTIYACQDKEDDALIGVKSTARKFGTQAKRGVAVSYFISVLFVLAAIHINTKDARELFWSMVDDPGSMIIVDAISLNPISAYSMVLPFALHLMWQIWRFEQDNSALCLKLFKSNLWAGVLLIIGFSSVYFTPL